MTYFTIYNRLFGSVELTKNADHDEYKYSTFGMGFDSRSHSSITNRSMGKNVLIFGAEMR